jgi:rhodanese-related sulfurtransferase
MHQNNEAPEARLVLPKTGGSFMKTGSSKKSVAILALCVLTGIFVTGSACALKASDVPRITIEELKAMMDKGTKVTIIDTQPRDVYDQGHIKGAISIPWKAQIALEDVWKLSSEIPIVTYCDCGPGEADSSSVASQLIDMGYLDVKVLKDPSIRGWKKAGYPMEK